MNENEKYRELESLLLSELNVFNEKEILCKVKKLDVNDNVLFYSNTLAYNYTPFYKEIRGNSLGVLVSGCPKLIKNKSIYFGTDKINRIVHYGKLGNVASVDYIIEDKLKKEVISIDNFDEVVKYIIAELSNGRFIKSVQIDDAHNASATYYVYDNDRLVQSLNYMKFNGVFIENEMIYEYDNLNLISRIYSKINNKFDCIYKR